MSKFVSKGRTTAYVKALTALQQLIEEEGLDKAERAAAEAFSDPRCDSLNSQGYWRSAGTACLGRLITGGHCQHGYYKPSRKLPHTAPGSDHTWLLLKNGVPTVYHSQPYGVSWETLQQLVDLCREYNLQFQIDARNSWWFPGHTVSIWITQGDREHA